MMQSQAMVHYLARFRIWRGIQVGVRFAAIRDGSPAAKAGLRAEDILVEFDAKQIDNLYDFTYALRVREPGDEVEVKVFRDGQEIHARVRLGIRR